MECNLSTSTRKSITSENGNINPQNHNADKFNVTHEDTNEPLIGAIDNGTSSVRFVVFSGKTATIVASHQIEIASFYPNEGWVEQDPKIILNSVIECVEETVKQLENRGIDPANIKTVGITNQRETTILWDKVTGEPLYNAIVWLDNRTEFTIDSLLQSKPNKDVNQLKDLTGLPINPYFSAMKYRWLIDNVPAVQKAIEEKRCLFGTVDTWIIWNITGGEKNGIHMTDVTNASRTLLMNLHTLQWDKTLTDFFDIPMDTLPEIRSSSEIYGKITIKSLKGVPISSCVGDQQAALIGQLCFKEGETKCTYGTGCFILTNIGSKEVKLCKNLLTTVAYQFGKNVPPVYALEGSVSAGGSTMRWLRDNMKFVPQIEDIERLATEVSSSKDVFFVSAFQGLYAPYWEPKARGLIAGLTMETDQRHIARAAIEGVGYQVAAVLCAMCQECGIDSHILKVDGGLSQNNLLLQFQADISGLSIVRQEMLESTSYGAAIAAGMAEGININLLDINMNEEVFKSQFSIEERTEKMAKWERAVNRSIMKS